MTAPPETVACVLGVEDTPIRVAFDGREPNPDHGLLLRRGLIVSFPFSQQEEIKYVAEGNGDARVGILWLKSAE